MVSAMPRARSAADFLRRPTYLRPYQTDAHDALSRHFEAHLNLAGAGNLGLEAPMGSGKTTTVKALAAWLLSSGQARLVVVAAPLDGIVLQWAARGRYSTGPGEGSWRLPGESQDWADAPRASAADLRDPTWWANAEGFYVTTRQAMCTSTSVAALGKSRVDLRRVLVVGDEGHHHGDGTLAGRFFEKLRERGAATLLVSGTPWHGRGSIFTEDTKVVRQSAAALALCVDPATGHPYAPRNWRLVRRIVTAWTTDRAEFAVEADVAAEPSYPRAGVEAMCRAAAEQWADLAVEVDGRLAPPRMVINVPGARAWREVLLAQLRCVGLERFGREPVVVDLIGKLSNRERDERQAQLRADGDARSWGDVKVDVVISCARMDEGVDWPPCSHVMCVRIPCSPLRILQRWARASRGKWRIAGYPAAWVDAQTLVLLTPALEGAAIEESWKQHREQAVLLAGYLADYEVASRWVDPRCFASPDQTWRRTAGRKQPRGSRLRPGDRGPANGGDLRPGTEMDRARAVARAVQEIQKRGGDGQAKIAELDAALERALPSVPASARKAALLSLASGGELGDAVEAARQRAQRAVAEGRPTLQVRAELQAELERIVAEFGHFDVSVPADWCARVAQFTAIDAEQIARNMAQCDEKFRLSLPAYQEWVRAQAAVWSERNGGKQPSPRDGSCPELDGRGWASVDMQLRKKGSTLSLTLGPKKRTYKESVIAARTFFLKTGSWPSPSSSDPSEAALGVALTNAKLRCPELCKAHNVPLNKHKKPQNNEQFTSFADFIVYSIRASNFTGKIGGTFAEYVVTKRQRSRSRGFRTPDLCQVTSLARTNSEIEADCWRFTLDGCDVPDPRPWSELLASGDHKRVVSAERTHYLDWQNSHLDDGVRWTDPRVGTGPKCPPAVRRPWTPPTTSTAAPAPSGEDLTQRGTCAS